MAKNFKSNSKSSSKGHKGKGKSKLGGQALKKKALNVFEIKESKGKRERQHNLDDVEDMRYHVDEIASEDDEEIDSDDAYGEAQEISASTITKKSDQKSKGQSQEESEDEEESEGEDSDLDGEGFIDLSEMLNDDPKLTKKDKINTIIEKPEISISEPIAKKNKITTHDLLNIESEESEDQGFSSSNDSDDEGAMDQLDQLVTRLDPKNNKVKKYLNEKNETYKESEFNLTSQNLVSRKLNLTDLLEPVQDEVGFNQLGKKVQLLTKKKKETQALAAPLAKRLQDRVTREAAFEEAKDKVSEWQPIVNLNRAADHLNFGKAPVEKASSSSLASNIKPESQMEKEIEKLLAQSNLKEKKIKEGEDLEMVKLDPKQIMERQQELRQMRELMFRNESKSKRVSKIKSKAFRRLKKKDKERDEDLQNEFDEDSDPESKMDAEVARARERMTLKHKNTSKWAKSLMKHGGRHAENQQALMDQINEHEKLTQKIRGGRSSDEENSDASEYDEEDNDARAHALNQLDQLISNAEPIPTKGVMGMKFMQNAMQQQQQETERMAQEARDDLLLLNSDHETAEVDVDEALKADAEIGGNQGRLAFLGLPQEATSPTLNPKKISKNKLNDQGQINKVSQSAEHVTKLSGPMIVGKKSKGSAKLAQEEQENPWLAQGDEATAVKKKRPSASQTANTAKIDKAALKLKKAKLGAIDTPQVNIDVNDALVIRNGQDSDDDDDDVTMVDGDQADLVPIDNPNAFTQKELIQLAFADDNVVQEFQEEKNRIEEQDAPKEIDNTLPGWGNWGGLSVKKKKFANSDAERAFKVKRNLLTIGKKGVAKEKRKDRELNNVIIDEKPNKKLLKYTVRDIPFPFQNREQYEQSLANPVGKEWNPSTTHFKKIKPRILTKKGQVIDPLEMKDH